MAIALWRPSRPLGTFQWDVTDWLSNVFDVDTTVRGIKSGVNFEPAMESYVKDNKLHLRAEIPGVDPKDINVSLEDGHICIKGERKRTTAGEDTCYCYEEMSYGKFSRCFAVPKGVDADKISARYENGMLELTLPFAETAKPRKLSVEGVTEAKGESNVS